MKEIPLLGEIEVGRYSELRVEDRVIPKGYTFRPYRIAHRPICFIRVTAISPDHPPKRQ